MDFKDQIKQLAERIAKLKDQILTEEATKNAFIMPFIQCLGYDVFNPLEVIPEFIADVGVKKGEKVDYAITKDNIPVILIECKHWKQKLSLHDGQLLRYFNVSKAKFAILTNGITYRFYTDLEEPNKMDEKPFFEFDITDLKDNHVDELKKFHKSYFDVPTIIATANEMKYVSLIKSVLHNELKNPSDNFIKYFISNIYEGRVTDKVLALFSELVKKSIQSGVSELITDRLKYAINAESNEQVEEKIEPTIITTTEEMEGFYIIKSILRAKIEGDRITFKDYQSFFSVNIDDNSRKVICKLYFNGAKKYIGIVDESKKEVKREIAKLDDLYIYADDLLSVVDNIEVKK